MPISAQDPSPLTVSNNGSRLSFVYIYHESRIGDDASLYLSKDLKVSCTESVANLT